MPHLEAGYRKYLHDFAKLIWQTSSPKWNVDDARSNVQRRRSTIRTTSPSRSITTAAESAWLTANGNTTI
jgi:hypothetical protein